MVNSVRMDYSCGRFSWRESIKTSKKSNEKHKANAWYVANTHTSGKYWGAFQCEDDDSVTKAV